MTRRRTAPIIQSNRQVLTYLAEIINAIEKLNVYNIPCEVGFFASKVALLKTADIVHINKLGNIIQKQL